LFALQVNKLIFPLLFQAGAQISDPIISTFNGQEVEVWPRITWSPRWGLMYKDVKQKVHGNSSVSQRSVLVINGQNIVVDGLSLDGTLIVNSVDEAEVTRNTATEKKLPNLCGYCHLNDEFFVLVCR
jgi:UDP-sugar pyrophosphorylase